MFWVLSNKREGRVFITGRLRDVDRLVQAGWNIEYKSRSWDKAYRAALLMAEARELIVEWYLEDEVNWKKKKLARFQSIR